SRLAADGWLERERIGRNSFYRLAERGQQTFEAATRHIYDPAPSDWTGCFELLLIGNAEDRDSAREALRNAGFGSPLPGVWVAPCCGWLAGAREDRPQQFLSVGREGTADLRGSHAAHLRSSAIGLDRMLRIAPDRQCGGSRQRSRSAEECGLRQPLAGRMGRA